VYELKIKKERKVCEKCNFVAVLSHVETLDIKYCIYITVIIIIIIVIILVLILSINRNNNN